MADEKTHDPWPELCALPIGRRIELDDGRGTTYVGAVVPRHGFFGDRILQLKLGNGYNVGVRVEPGARFRALPESPRPGIPEPPLLRDGMTRPIRRLGRTSDDGGDDRLTGRLRDRRGSTRQGGA